MSKVYGGNNTKSNEYLDWWQTLQNRRWTHENNPHPICFLWGVRPPYEASESADYSSLHLLGILWASKENPINRLTQPSTLPLYISIASYVFHIFSEKRASFPAFVSSFLSLLGAIYYFIPNYARAHCTERCWIASPPETRREGMLQETQQRFPAPCKHGPFLKKKKHRRTVCVKDTSYAK